MYTTVQMQSVTCRPTLHVSEMHEPRMRKRGFKHEQSTDAMQNVHSQPFRPAWLLEAVFGSLSNRWKTASLFPVNFAVRNSNSMVRLQATCLLIWRGCTLHHQQPLRQRKDQNQRINRGSWDSFLPGETSKRSERLRSRIMGSIG